MVRTLEAPFLRQRLQEYYGSPLPREIKQPDYLIRCCPDCNLEFADPLIPGNKSFYQWLGNHPGYYAKDRWEWHVVLAKLEEIAVSRLNVLELGFGPGNFYKMAASLPYLHLTRAEAYPPFYGEALGYLVDKNKKFDAIAIFHYLEHVPDRVKMMKELCGLLKRQGILFFSLPFSPTSVEYSFFDPSNYPPHHLTRWDPRSLANLARICQMTIKLTLPKARHPLVRTATVVNLIAQDHSFTPRTIGETFWNCGTRPIITLKELLKQLRRDKINGKPVADVVLCIMKKAD